MSANGFKKRKEREVEALRGRGIREAQSIGVRGGNCALGESSSGEQNMIGGSYRKKPEPSSRH